MPFHLPSSSDIPFLQPADVTREARAASERHNAIEKQLLEDRRAAKNELKLLLLGSTTSGKAELIQRMKLAHHGVTKEERTFYQTMILTNIVESMRATINALPLLDLTLQPSNEACRELILATDYEDIEDHLAEDVQSAVSELWKDPAVQMAVRDRSSEYQIHSSAGYFFEAIERIFSPNYIPSDEDILKCQIKKAGVTETAFKVGELTYKIVDPSNQGSDRKKWLPSFEHVTAILFVVDISEYDEMLYEDENMSKLQDSLTYFDSICNSRWFANTSIILMLNRMDMFAEKLPNAPLSKYFPDYAGGEDYDAACDYVLHRFVSLNQSFAKRQIYAHYTYMADVQQVKFVLSAVQDILFQVFIK